MIWLMIFVYAFRVLGKGGGVEVLSFYDVLFVLAFPVLVVTSSTVFLISWQMCLTLLYAK